MTTTRQTYGKLTLGAAAAERDIAQGLSEYFVESLAFTRLAEGNKRIVIGNRGTGKSAIFQIIADRRRKARQAVIELAPGDYSYEMLSRVLASEAAGSWAKHGAYAVAWKYLLYLSVIQACVGEATGDKRGARGRLQRYLRDNHGIQQGSKLQALVEYLKRMEGIKLGPVEASLKTRDRLRELDQMYKLDVLNSLLGDLRNVLLKQPVVILIDELDRGWDASEDAKAFVSGLFQACVSLNQFSANLRVYMSLRQELYENIPALYEDAQKARDLIEYISWDEGALKNLVANRIRHSVPSLRGSDDDYAWAAVFSETLTYRQTRSFKYFVDRTLFRPREIIELGTRALEAAQGVGGSGFPIDYASVNAAELGYSKARVQDIAAEYRFQFPGLAGVFEAFRQRQYKLTREDLELLCLGLSMGEPPTLDTDAWLKGADPEAVIDILWRVGFLQARVVGGRKSGSQYLGSHQVSSLNCRTSAQFQVHPMFRAHLGMRETRRQRT